MIKKSMKTLQTILYGIGLLLALALAVMFVPGYIVSAQTRDMLPDRHNNRWGADRGEIELPFNFNERLEYIRHAIYERERLPIIAIAREITPIPFSRITITFNANGGTPATQTVMGTPGSQLSTLPQRPTRTGYVFAGWYSTPRPTGGTPFNSNSTIPNTNTTYSARWVVMNLYYQNFVNVNSPAARNQADANVDEIKHLFLENFGVNLVPRSDALHEPALIEGLSASDLLDINRSSHNTVHFRFVDFYIGVAGRARQVWGEEGSTSLRLGEMVVTMQLNPEELRFAIVHEIAHVLGAYDCLSPGCVMNHGTPRYKYSHWCDPCRVRMHNYLALRWQNNPFLRN